MLRFSMAPAAPVFQDIPDNVTEIGRAVLSYCTQLTEVKLPKGLTTIP